MKWTPQNIALRSLDRRAHLYPLQLHLFSQVTRRRLNELLLGVTSRTYSLLRSCAISSSVNFLLAMSSTIPFQGDYTPFSGLVKNRVCPNHRVSKPLMSEDMDLKTVLSKTQGLNVRKKGIPESLSVYSPRFWKPLMSGGETFRNPVCTKQRSVKSCFAQSVSLNKAFQNRVCPIYRVHFT